MGAISKFTLVEGIGLIRDYTHDEIDRLLMQFGLEDVAPQTGLPSTTKNARVNQLLRFLQENPERKGPFGANLGFELVEHVIDKFVESLDDAELEEVQPRLIRSLERDGYIIDRRSLKPMIPSPRGPAVIESELLDLLERFRFMTPKGHLEQAIAAHTRGEWASANAQLRTFVESLFDHIAKKLGSSAAAAASTSEARRRLLATISPPFFLTTLNEWDSVKGHGFLQGFWRRLHPQGSHPGLSGEEDSTFRLHLVQLVSHHLLKRLAARPPIRGGGGRGV